MTLESPPHRHAIRGAVLGLALVLTAALPGRSGAQTQVTRVEIDALVQRLNSAAAARDLDAVMALYALPDSAARARERSTYADLFGLDSLAVEVRVSWSGAHAGGEAAVFRQATYVENGRRQANSDWLTMVFSRTGAGVRIAAEESRLYAHTRWTDLAVTVDPDSGTLAGVAMLHVAIDRPGEDQLLLSLNRGLDVLAAEDGAGRGLPLVRVADALRLPLGGPAAAGDSFVVRLRFAGRPFNESREQGYSQFSIAPEGCFASWVTGWYPSVAGPGGKSPGRIAFTVPAALSVAASGRRVASTPQGARRRDVFGVSDPVKFSFAAARYEHREQSVDGVALGIYLLRGGTRKADLYLARTARVLRFLRGYYGGYPYDGFRIVEIPRSGAGTLGGSSEQGMSLFTEGGLPADEFPLALIAHEMGHTWWGNLVSGKETVLDEGLAQLSAVLAVRALEGEAAVRRFLAYGTASYPQSARAYFRDFATSPGKDLPLGARRSGAAERSALHDLADTKGHFAYDMLRQKLGARAFQAGLRGAIRDYRGREMSLADLEGEWERAGGRRLGRFFADWFTRPGAPEFVLRDSIRAEGARFVVAGSITQLRDLYDADVEVVAVLDRGVEVRRIPVSGPETPFRFVTDRPPRALLLDPDYRTLRWTGDFKNALVLVHCQRLRGLGRLAEAVATLDSCLARDPDAVSCRAELGVCQQRLGRLDLAEQAYRAVADGYRLYPAYSPAVPLCLLRLGELCDIAKRRAEALGWYRQVLALPDPTNLHAAARASLTAPYAPPVPPTTDVLRALEGTYTIPGAGDYQVRLNESGILCLSGPQVAESGLEWTAGGRFVLPGREEISLEFVKDPDGMVRRMIVRLGKMEFPATRRQDAP